MIDEWDDLDENDIHWESSLKIWKNSQNFFTLLKNSNFEQIFLRTFQECKNLICYSLGPNKKNWVKIKFILKTVNFYLEHPSHARILAERHTPKNDTHFFTR